MRFGFIYTANLYRDVADKVVQKRHGPLKEAKREILRDMHVKELIQSNHSER